MKEKGGIMIVIKFVCEVTFWAWFTLAAIGTPFVLYRAAKESK